MQPSVENPVLRRGGGKEQRGPKRLYQDQVQAHTQEKEGSDNIDRRWDCWQITWWATILQLDFFVLNLEPTTYSNSPIYEWTAKLI